MPTTIKLRRDTAANWGSVNPVLAVGEPGWDTTNGVLKIGDGSTAWSSLRPANFSDYESTQLIEEVVLGSNQSSVTFSSIPQTFRHLELVIHAVGVSSAAAMNLRINADTGNNYDWQTMRGSASTTTSNESLAASSIQVGTMYSTGPCMTRVGISNYTASLEKVVLADSATKSGTSTGNLRRETFAGFWRTANPVTSLTVLGGSGLATGTVLSLYGRATVPL